MRKSLCIFLAGAMVCLAGCSGLPGKEAAETTEQTESAATEAFNDVEEETITEEAATEEVKKPEIKNKTTSSAEVSDDIYSFQIVIDGDVYQFPMTYSDFVSFGWEHDPGAYTDEIELQPNQYSPTEIFKKDGMQIYGVVANFGMNTVGIEECIIAGVTLEEYYLKDVADVSIELPNGIAFRKSSLDDVIAAYGDPSDTYEGDIYTTLTYSLDIYQDIEIKVDVEKDVVSEISIRNLVPIEDGNEKDESAEVSGEVPDCVKKYEAPSSLTADLEDFVCEFDGVLYRLPVPVSVFVENGWKVIESDSDMVVKGQSSGWVTLMKNNQKFKTIADNYDDNATSIDNCFVTEIEVSDYKTNMPLKLSNGIEFGMSDADLQKILKDMSDVEKDDSSSLSVYYTIKIIDSNVDTIELSVDKETKKVDLLSLSHSYYAEKDYMSR